MQRSWIVLIYGGAALLLSTAVAAEEAVKPGPGFDDYRW